jgi:hypothetical protein
MTSMDNTPDSPAKTPVGYTTQGGNYWTLITPEIWKVLHAVLQFGTAKSEITLIPAKAGIQYDGGSQPGPRPSPGGTTSSICVPDQ